MTSPELPNSLAQIRDDFLEMPESERLTLLLEFANELPDLPPELAAHPELQERVLECQSPVFVRALIKDGIVSMHATAAEEAPTTRGFASILVQGITGLQVEEVLAIPADFALTIGLTRVVSPLRLGGMTGMLARIKRQVREASIEVSP